MVVFIMSITRESILQQLQKIDEAVKKTRQNKTLQDMSTQAQITSTLDHSTYEYALQLWQNAKDYINPEERFTLSKANDVLTTLKIKEDQEKGIQVLQFLKQAVYPHVAQVVVEESTKVIAKTTGAPSISADLTGWVSGLVTRSLVSYYLKNTSNTTVINGLQKNADELMKMLSQARQQQIQLLTDQMLSFIVYVANRSGGLDEKEFIDIQQQFIKAIVALSYDMNNDSLVDDIKRVFGIKVHSPSPFEFQQMMFELFADICEQACKSTPKTTATNSLVGLLTNTGKAVVTNITSPFNSAQEETLKRVAELFKPSNNEAKHHEQSMALSEDANLRPTKKYLNNLEEFLKATPPIFLGTPKFWLQDYSDRTFRAHEFQQNYQDLISQLVFESQTQYETLVKNPNYIIKLLTNTKKYLAKNPELFWLKDLLRSQFEVFITTLMSEPYLLDKKIVLAIKQHYVEVLGGDKNKLDFGNKVYDEYLLEQKNSEEKQQILLNNANKILLGNNDPNLSHNDLNNPVIQQAAHYHSPSSIISKEEIDAQLTQADENSARAKAQSSARATNTTTQETSIDYGIRGGLYFAAERLVFSFSKAMGAESKTLTATGTEFDVSVYKQIEHVVKTDLLERTTKWLTKNYLTHETSLRTSWTDSKLTGGLKDFVASVTGTVSSAIIGEIFYRCFPPNNALNAQSREQINQAKEQFFNKHRDVIELISTELLRVIVYIKNSSDVAKINNEMDAILSQINQAIAVLANKTMEDSQFTTLLQTLFPGSAKSASALQLEQAIYQLCSDLCIKSANAINDNPLAEKAAGEVKTSAQSLVSVAAHLGIGVAETASELLTATSALYVFNKVQRTQLEYMADRFDASSHVLFSQDLYENSIQPNDRFNTACSHLISPHALGFLKTQPLLGSPDAWLLDYQVRTEPNEQQNEDYKKSIRNLLAASKQQMHEIVEKPKLLADILQATKTFIIERADEAELLELLPKLRLQLLQLTIQIQEYFFAEKTNDLDYRTNAIEALGSVRLFYTDTLQGDASDIINARELRANQSGLKNGLNSLETLLQEQKESLFSGSSALWLYSDSIMPNRQNPTLTSQNVDGYIDNTLKFIAKLSEENPDLCSLYRLMLLKQLTEYITPGTSTPYGNAYVRGTIEERLLSPLFNGKIPYSILDDIAHLEFVNSNFNDALLLIMAYFPDQSDLFGLSLSQGRLTNTTTTASELHQAIDIASKKEKDSNLEQAKKRALQAKSVIEEKENVVIDPSPDYTRYQNDTFVKNILNRQLDNKTRADSLNTRRDINASTRLTQVKTHRSVVMQLPNAVSKTAGSGVDYAFGFETKQKNSLFQIVLEKEPSFFENIAESAKLYCEGVATRKITSWIVQDATKPILSKVKDIFAPQTSIAGDIAVDYATQATGWMAGIFAEKLVTQLLIGSPDNLDQEQKQQIEKACLTLCSNYQSTIETIAGHFLILLTYVKAHPSGVDIDELNEILSQLNGAIATLCQNVALQPEGGLNDLIKKLKGENLTLTPNELQKQLMYLCVELCENASQAEAQGLIGHALKTVQSGSNSLPGTVANLGVSTLDFLTEFTTNRRLVTEYNSLQRSTLKTLSNKLTFQANTLDTRSANELINRVDETYLQQLEAVAESKEKFYGSPQSFVREYRRYVNPSQNDSQEKFRGIIEKLIQRSAEQSAKLLISPNRIISILESEQKYDERSSEKLQVREQLVQLAYGLEKNLTLLANGYHIDGISDGKKYANDAAMALGHIKYHYVNTFQGDTSDIDNALRLRFATPMLMDKLITLQAILEKNPQCCRGAQNLWLSAQQSLDIPLPSHMMNAASLTPENIKSWLDNTRHLLKSLENDPQLAELYRLLVIKQICELVTERFDSFIQFPAQEFLNEMGLDYSTIQAIATLSETQFDFTYSFQSILAVLKDSVCLTAKTNIYSDPLIEASDRVSSHLMTQRLMKENRARELKDYEDKSDQWNAAEQRLKRSQAMSSALFQFANQQPEEKSKLHFNPEEMENYIPNIPNKTFSALAAEAKKEKVETDVKAVTEPLERKSDVSDLFIQFNKLTETINLIFNRISETPTETLPSLAQLDINFTPDEWQKMKQYVISSAARDGGEMVLQAGLDMSESWIPPGASKIIKLGGGFIVIHLTGLLLQKATELYLTPQNSLNQTNKAMIEKSIDENFQRIKPAIDTISTEMLRLLNGVAESKRTLTEEDLDKLIQPFVRGIVVLITQSLQNNSSFFKLLKLQKSETTTTLELTASILELCKQMCENAEAAIIDNPFAELFDVHQFSLAQREGLRILAAKFDHVIKDIRHQEQRLSLANLRADENYNQALRDLPKDLLLGDPITWLTDFSIRSPTTKDEQTYRDLIEPIFDASSKQSKELITHPESISQLLEKTASFLEDKKNITEFAHSLALQSKIRQQVLHIAHGIIQHLQAISVTGTTLQPDESIKIQQYTRDAMTALSAIRQNYSRLGGDQSDFENIMQLSHRTHKAVLETAFNTLQQIIDPKKILTGSGILWLGAKPSETTLHSQIIHDLEKQHSNTLAFIDELKESHKPQLAELYRLLVIKQLAEIIANNSLDEAGLTKLAKDILPSYGITSYLAMYEIANIGRIKFDLQENLITLVGTVSDQLDMQKLALELNLDLSAQQGDPIDAMIRSSLFVDTLRNEKAMIQTPHYKTAIESTIATMDVLNIEMQKPLREPKPAEPVIQINRKNSQEEASLANLGTPLLNIMPKQPGVGARMANWFIKLGKSIWRLLRSCWPASKAAVHPTEIAPENEIKSEQKDPMSNKSQAEVLAQVRGNSLSSSKTSSDDNSVRGSTLREENRNNLKDLTQPLLGEQPKSPRIRK